MMTTEFRDGAALAIAEDGLIAVRQPHWPDGTPWASEQEAMAWIDLFVESLNNENSLLPGDNPDNPTKQRPEPDDQTNTP